MSSPRKRVDEYTIITVIVTILLGLYMFLEVNFVIGFLVILLAAFIYYTIKRLEGVS